jgi:3-dehydroquinate synthase
MIVAFGGGVIGDLAGFVAATILRGIAFVQIPTTLLSQVDSSVGGKVGIDHPVGKNLIGAFHQPCAVLIDVAFLRSLPEREFRSGLAEAVKIAAALDLDFFRFIARNARRIKRTNPVLLKSLVSKSIGLKAAVVMDDEYELGIRKALNLGHTIGHAIEASSGFRILHGEAVSMGMAAEAEIAVGLGLMQEKDRTSMIRTLRTLKLKTALPKIRHRAEFFRALHADKKTVAGKVRFVLPSAIGACAIGVEVPPEAIERVIGSHT